MHVVGEGASGTVSEYLQAAVQLQLAVIKPAEEAVLLSTDCRRVFLAGAVRCYTGSDMVRRDSLPWSANGTSRPFSPADPSMAVLSLQNYEHKLPDDFSAAPMRPPLLYVGFSSNVG